ncbi:hypothetical protein K402DRAFT_395306 [Aulographum hederae CBS 113979]|uniref:Uncharacterized protein n=1 Tax=Aulographum hederae CBS 113979 TaxID=1176131 RepID=A0A6G1GVE7_9PEZI|nr:hypothetical protein K402DRAFT_395306 [Aulographum hederae CBS 113979]
MSKMSFRQQQQQQCSTKDQRKQVASILANIPLAHQAQETLRQADRNHKRRKMENPKERQTGRPNNAHKSKSRIQKKRQRQRPPPPHLPQNFLQSLTHLLPTDPQNNIINLKPHPLHAPTINTKNQIATPIRNLKPRHNLNPLPPRPRAQHPGSAITNIQPAGRDFFRLANPSAEDVGRGRAQG